MATTSPKLLTPDEAAAIARCSIKTVRRAYASGALTAYRRRGSRAVLLDNRDVLDWVQGQIVQPNAQAAAPVGSMSARPHTRRTARQGDRPSRTPKLGSQLRFDVSTEALRDRRMSRTEPRPQGR